MKEIFHRKQISVDEVMEIDEKFHREVAIAADNEQLVNITDYITRITIPSRKKTIEKILSIQEGENFISLHEQLIQIIEQKQFDQIERAVQDHYVYWKEKE